MIPLATRMRPLSLEEFVGQEHFLYKGSLLYNSIKNKTFENAIFFGPSGTGKTTLARIIAREMDADFVEMNAAVTGIKELKEVIESSKTKFFGLQKEKTYVYVDEFHRWNKLQQDTLLKALEEGVINFIGSTTENPYFAVNNAVLSRVRSIYEFKALKASANRAISSASFFAFSASFRAFLVSLSDSFCANDVVAPINTTISSRHNFFNIILVSFLAFIIYIIAEKIKKKGILRFSSVIYIIDA